MIKCVTTPLSIPCQNNLSYLNSENNIRGMYTPVCPPSSVQVYVKQINLYHVSLLKNTIAMLLL